MGVVRPVPGVPARLSISKEPLDLIVVLSILVNAARGGVRSS